MKPDRSFPTKNQNFEGEDETEAFVRYIRKLHLNLEQHTEELEYKNAVLILVDAVLSMNRKYDSFVVPRIKLIKESGIKTLDELKETLETETIQDFCKIWQYNHTARVTILKKLVEKFLQIKSSFEVLD